ncbi:maleylpyruvate isomerase family mycothiol-dependent enzyme [Nocardiopsis gilva YIM 90087]|uniref:Maleylpyruvate isomerase family mycothiol-dependent enzyme n=1 Tax=Nocardiopsis gilva YIM 90087 TaxID=1235441 RepID=A0A223S7K5_9ACTN|nr:maleylpyruvate isomerase family mycothiol-dependent enzyme [Nocardiopsis gilva]ASU84094.1 maleylpyruvate isomerase family mycothiol-dependent enzyme [Nocardiopsis gilva YIM 90087]
MTNLSFDRCCAEIVAQTDLLRTLIPGADMAAPVPSCPEWNLGQLLRHLGDAHRRVETTVAARATEPACDAQVADVTDEDPIVLDAWLAEGAARLAQTLRAAGPDAVVWTVVEDRSAAFWARRMTHETVVHRADVALAVGAEFSVGEEVALDAVDEWMGFGTRPEAFASKPGVPDLLGPGRTLHVHATDTAPQAAAEWLVDLTGPAPTWRRAHAKAAVAVRGPLTDLLMLIYGRPTRNGTVDILGDASLFDLWRQRSGFWLEAEDKE